MIIRATINLDDDEQNDRLSNMGSVEHGVYGIDKDGVYHMYYGSPTYLCKFTEVEEIEN